MYLMIMGYHGSSWEQQRLAVHRNLASSRILMEIIIGLLTVNGCLTKKVTKSGLTGLTARMEQTEMMVRMVQMDKTESPLS